MAHEQTAHEHKRRRSPPPPPPPQPPPRRDYYAILHVERDASPKKIKRAYYAAARRWHPDKNRAPGDEARLAKAERNFKLIARAYEVLSDKATRDAYDRGENVDDPKFAQRMAQQQQSSQNGNVRFGTDPRGQTFNFHNNGGSFSF
mmetsp:Transcript_9058/g.15198  ORF Transcript_9058/g.15198 Transcript_9058/m.15198 type:complete len:146 (+) Transcript_9058:122-559(+)